MNCMADSKENYKFYLGVEGLIGLNVLQKKKTRFIASSYFLHLTCAFGKSIGTLLHKKGGGRGYWNRG